MKWKLLLSCLALAPALGASLAARADLTLKMSVTEMAKRPGRMEMPPKSEAKENPRAFMKELMRNFDKKVLQQETLHLAKGHPAEVVLANGTRIRLTESGETAEGARVRFRITFADKKTPPFEIARTLQTNSLASVPGGHSKTGAVLVMFQSVPPRAH